MARKIQIVAVVVGVIIFGVTRIDVYTAHDVPVALFPLLASVHWTPSLSESILLISSFGYHAGIIFLVILWRSRGISRKWTALAITGFLVEAAFVFYMSIGSGYQNHEALIGTILAVSIVIPSLLVVASRSEHDEDGKAPPAIS
jgi:hypothetical protein